MIADLRRARYRSLSLAPLPDVNNYRRITTVMKDGVVVDRDALPTHPIVTVPANNA